jgi:hypothetical protein
MAITKVLITVKAYPTLSAKYDELVCTAGVKENGDWIRIYPIPFRKKDYDERYRKYDWIEIDLIKNQEDFRPESYRPISPDTKIKIVGHLDTKDNWQERKKYCLRKVYDNLHDLIQEAKNKNISLATFKPKEIIDFIAEPTKREWDRDKILKIQAKRRQLKLFEENLVEDFQIVKKLPYKFKYKFIDSQGKKSNMMIEDWEIGQLFWNCLARHNCNENKAIEDVRKKYFDDFAKTKDIYFFLGTTHQFHRISKNPFMIIGVFYPPFTPKEMQRELPFQ